MFNNPTNSSRVVTMVSEQRSFDSGQAYSEEWMQQAFTTMNNQYQNLVSVLNTMASNMAYPNYPHSSYPPPPINFQNPIFQNHTFPNPYFLSPPFSFLNPNTSPFTTTHQPTTFQPVFRSQEKKAVAPSSTAAAPVQSPPTFPPIAAKEEETASAEEPAAAEAGTEEETAPAEEPTADETEYEEETDPIEEPTAEEAETDKQVFEKAIAMEDPEKLLSENGFEGDSVKEVVLSGTFFISDAAKNQVALNPINTVFDAKRLFGRRFNDPYVQSDMKLWPFKGKEKQLSAEEISSIVLVKMKEVAEEFLGITIKNAVETKARPPRKRWKGDNAGLLYDCLIPSSKIRVLGQDSKKRGVMSQPIKLTAKLSPE